MKINLKVYRKAIAATAVQVVAFVGVQLGLDPTVVSALDVVVTGLVVKAIPNELDL